MTGSRMTAPAEARARALLAGHQVTSVPVPVEDIAAAEAQVQQVVRHRHKGPEYGFTLRDGKRFIIGINSNTSAGRQRCAIAHCLAHVLLHPRDLIVCYAARLGSRDFPSAASDREEAEANLFSAELLMPAGPFTRAVDEFAKTRPEGETPAPRDELVNEMAKKFGVAPESVTYRLIALGLLAT